MTVRYFGRVEASKDLFSCSERRWRRIVGKWCASCKARGGGSGGLLGVVLQSESDDGGEKMDLVLEVLVLD